MNRGLVKTNSEDLFCNKEKCTNLEEILNQKMSLDTDIMDFVLIAGWDYSWRYPMYKKADKDIKDRLKKYVKQRKERTAAEQNMEGRLRNSIFKMGQYNNSVRTLGDLKRIIETEGLQRFRGMHYKTLAHLNSTLVEYGIEPIIKIGGQYPPSSNFLRRYGLERARQ